MQVICRYAILFKVLEPLSILVSVGPLGVGPGSSALR